MKTYSVFFHMWGIKAICYQDVARGKKKLQPKAEGLTLEEATRIKDWLQRNHPNEVYTIEED